MSPLARTAAAVALLASACGDGGGAPDATAADAGPPDAWAGPPTAPAPPMLVSWSCPAGWTAVPDGELGFFTCAPPEPAAASDCAAGAVPALGETGCRPLGAPCPAGDYAEGATGVVLRVLAGAPPGGDGSEAAPFDTLANAITAAPAGATILLSKGTHAAAAIIGKSLEIRGACAAETVLVAPPPPPAAPDTAALSVGTGTVTLADFTLTGARLGLRAAGGTTAVRGVHFDDLWGAAVVVDSAILSLSDAAVTRTRLYSNGERGFALLALDGSEVTVERAYLAANHQQAVRAEGSSISLVDTIIAGTEPMASGTAGQAIVVTDGGRVTAERALLTGNTEASVVVIGQDGLVSLTDAVVRDTRPRPLDGQTGVGAIVIVGDLEVTRVRFEGNLRGGVAAQSPAARCRIADSLVQGCPEGAGIGVYYGGDCVVERTVVEGATGLGIAVPDSTATLRDVVVRDTSLAPDGIQGYGLQVGYTGTAAAVTAERVLLARNRSVGVLITGGELTAADLRIVDMGSDATEIRTGRALHVQAGGRAHLERVRFERALAVGLVVMSGATLDGRDVVITETLPHPCRDLPPADPLYCLPDRAAGSAIATGDGATVDLVAFELTDNALCGAQIFGGLLTLRDGLVARNAIGVNLQVDGYDVARLQENVRYEDNGVNLDARVLPTPEAPIGP